MEFSYPQTENFEMEKLSSDTGYFKKPVEINRGFVISIDECQYISTQEHFHYLLKWGKYLRVQVLDPSSLFS